MPLENHPDSAQDAAQAWRVFWQALKLALHSQAVPVALYSLAGIAALHAKEGTTELALELAMYSETHPSSSQQTKDTAQRLHAELEAQLSPQQIEAIRLRARSITLENVMQGLALKPQQSSGLTHNVGPLISFDI